MYQNLLSYGCRPIGDTMKTNVSYLLLGQRAAGAPYGKTQEWWPPPYS
jgi:hypothetical protein